MLLGISVQSYVFFVTTLSLFVLFLSASLILTATYLAAIKRYQAERKGVGSESILGALGDRLSNTAPTWFYVPYMVLIVVTVYTGVFLFGNQFSLDTRTLVIIAVLGGILLVEVAYLNLTTSGRSRWRLSKITSEYYVFGNEDWVLQIRLAELMRDVEQPKSFRSNVARSVLDRLMTRENLMGDAVRRIMSDPEHLQNAADSSTIPGQWRYFRFSILLSIPFAIAMIIFTLGALSWPSAYFDLSIQFFPLVLVLNVALICSLLYQATTVNERRRKAHLACQDIFYSPSS
jgi:hypothetical protein